MKFDCSKYFVISAMGIIMMSMMGCDLAEKASTSLLDEDEATMIFRKAKTIFGTLTLPDSLYHNSTDSAFIKLGQQLFYDENLSVNGKISCNTCHPIENYGMDGLSTAMGHHQLIGKRNTPTVFNAFLQYAQFWDARAINVEEQLLEPLLNPREMGMKDTTTIIKYINTTYPSLIKMALDKREINLLGIKRSIGAFERTLTTPSRFDRYLLGMQDALSDDEKMGLSYFMNEGCINCHNGVLLGGNMAQKFALFGYYWDYTNSDTYDDGIYTITNNPSDKFLFKVSGLRNIAKTAPYFHDGSVKDLSEAIHIMAKAELGKELSEEKIKKIEIFLHSLTGELIDYQAPSQN